MKIKVDSGEPQWIWSPKHAKDKVPPESCYFRKSFTMGDVEQGKVQVTCDDRYDLYVNGRLVGSGSEWQKLKSYDIQRFLQNGSNTIAIRGENITSESAGLVARVTVRQKGSTDVSHSTDATWRTSDYEAVGWEKPGYDDAAWPQAQVLGEFGHAAPWGNQVTATDGAQIARFTIAPEFRVERVMKADETGSLIAMTFNEFGEILASREGGPLLIITDNDQDGVPETTNTYCDKIKTCQGILPLNGNVFAIGDGPEGIGLYRLTDENQDRQADTVKLLLKFKGEMHEHGPHAVVLGPDGLLYVMIGNHTNCVSPEEATGPHHHWYEGDLVQPRYEDAGGHAVGIKAPGGVVLRTDTEGSFVQTFAGGFRNAYDIAFNRQGDLFTFDSDMEWDEGLPWYRPTRVNHITAGGEFGWRSGWANWPEYFYDSLPAALECGARLADGHRGLQPLHDAAALSQCAVRLRLVARADSGDQADAVQGHLRSQERGLPRRAPAQRHRYRSWARRLALLLHGRSRHRRRHLPRGMDGQSAAPPRDARRGRSDLSAAAGQCLGPATGRHDSAKTRPEVGSRADRHCRERQEQARGSRPRPRPDAIARSVPDGRFAGEIVARSGSRAACQGRVPDGPAS